jgi:hypothetical protein
MFKELIVGVDDLRKRSKTMDKILKKKSNAETRATDDFEEGVSERSEICEENY